MDKPEKPCIPVNTRTIGNPEGIYLLYLEDYVHTFIKKLIFSQINSKDEFSDGTAQEVKIVLYGKRFEENGQSIMVVSGAVEYGGVHNREENNAALKYFPSSSFLGSAIISLNKDNGLRFEISVNNTRVILDDFYIYYDQNEEMQNYLIDWNNTVRESSVPKSGVRVNADNAVQLGRIAQAYNKEEAKVGFIWGAMNVMCLGFIVCVMAYGIISINNYSKMKSMQDSIDYCMTLVSENIKKSDELSAVMNKIDNITSANVLNIEGNISKEDKSGEKASEENILQENGSEENKSEEQMPEKDKLEEKMTEQKVDAEIWPVIQNSVPQYYVVQPGDTLRGISFKVYGDYLHVDKICEENNISDPNNILYGQKLLLP